eukprot:1160241-Pelagomonas_calceolata.AAC.4
MTSQAWLQLSRSRLEGYIQGLLPEGRHCQGEGGGSPFVQWKCLSHGPLPPRADLNQQGCLQQCLRGVEQHIQGGKRLTLLTMRIQTIQTNFSYRAPQGVVPQTISCYLCYFSYSYLMLLHATSASGQRSCATLYVQTPLSTDKAGPLLSLIVFQCSCTLEESNHFQISPPYSCIESNQILLTPVQRAIKSFLHQYREHDLAALLIVRSPQYTLPASASAAGSTTLQRLGC